MDFHKKGMKLGCLCFVCEGFVFSHMATVPAVFAP